MLIEFFVRRPIFTAVLSLVLLLAGSVVIPGLPVAQYPNIVPPQVTVTAVYTGASAEVVEATVTTPLEQEINGVPGMKYLQSTSRNDGTSTITVTFDIDRNVDDAAVDVQNRITAVEGRLPEEVRRTGLRINKNSSQTIMAFGLYAEGGEYTNLYVSNYADLYIRDALRRVRGVGEVRIYGERKYAMRLWLDPDKLASRGLTASDVGRALARQNLQVGAGQVGMPPAPAGQDTQISVRALGRLEKPSEFANLVISEGRDGNLVRLKDVGRAELGAEDYSTFLRFNGRNAVGITVDLLPGANALEVDRGVRAELARLAQDFPPGLRYTIAFDTTAAVDESIHEVLETLVEAIVLVVLVIFVFLQNWRTTLIPVITIPVSLVGTFAFVQLLGFSINTLVLFGITLATGLVVDDAIVVIENIARTARARLLPARLATAPAVAEIFGAVVATSLVLVAVFVPVAFFPGTTGQLYRQFALTIAVSIALSAFVALTLTPALTARIPAIEHEGKGPFFAAVNHLLDGLSAAYGSSLRLTMRATLPVLTVFALALGATWWMFERVPRGFVPTEDQGYFIVLVQGPEGTSLAYTDRVMAEVEAVLRRDPDIANIFAAGGFSFGGNAPNKASLFPNMRPLSERRGEEHSVKAAIARLRGPLSEIKGAVVVAFEPPAIQGVGSTGGFTFQLEDRRGLGLAPLADTARALVTRAAADPRLAGLFSAYTAGDPQLRVRVDREKARALGVDLEEAFRTLQVYMGSQYVNDFEMFNRPYRVYVQADQQFRAEPADLKRFYVRATSGRMVSLASLVSVERTTAPQIITHHNLFRSAEITGAPAPGTSSAQAIAAMEELARETLPQGMTWEWSGLSLEEQQSGTQTVFIFGLGVVFVFLVLAAQYESVTDPLIILLSVPLALLGGLGALALRGLDNDVYAQIGFVMLIGLAAKNAILIVEFANQLHREQGLALREAAIEAARTRLRPILMTSLAFILGVVPLVGAEGAGSASRHSLGTAVMGGMILSTVLSLYVVPVLYVTVNSLLARLRRGSAVAGSPDTSHSAPLAAPSQE